MGIVSGVPSSLPPNGAAGGGLAGTYPNPTVVTAKLPGYEWDYAQIVVPANVTDTSEATGTALITSSAVVYDGAPVVAEFFAPYVQTPNNAAGDFVSVMLWEGATELARFATWRNPVAGSALRTPGAGRFRFTPAVGAHTYLIAAYTNTTTGTPAIGAGVGGAVAHAPAYLRIVKV